MWQNLEPMQLAPPRGQSSGNFEFTLWNTKENMNSLTEVLLQVSKMEARASREAQRGRYLDISFVKMPQLKKKQLRLKINGCVMNEKDMK